jgi:hypothetical protein
MLWQKDQREESKDRCGGNVRSLGVLGVCVGAAKLRKHPYQ